MVPFNIEWSPHQPSHGGADSVPEWLATITVNVDPLFKLRSRRPWNGWELLIPKCL
jgi:hypothetical protein